MSYIILFLISIVGGMSVYILRNVKINIKAILSFSGSYLLGICFLHLLPELFSGGYNETVGAYLLVGFFLQIILDYTSGGIEHGHTHVNQKRMNRFPLLVFISLCLHAFLESFPLLSFTNEETQNTYFFALLIHKLPISFILGSLLFAYKLKVKNIIAGVLIFSLMAPIGAYMGTYLLYDDLLFKNLLAISVGIIFHLATTIILESDDKHKMELKKFTPMLAGVGLALLSLLNH